MLAVIIVPIIVEALLSAIIDAIKDTNDYPNFNYEQ